MQQQKEVGVEHYQRVVNRLSSQIGALTVEITSLTESMIDKERENMELKARIRDLEEPEPAMESEAEGELVK